MTPAAVRDWRRFRDIRRALEFAPPAPVVALGLVIDILAVGQLIVDPEPAVIQLLEVGFPVVLTSAGFYSAYYVYRSDRAEAVQPRILFVIGIFMAVSTVTVTVIHWMRVLEGNPIGDIHFTFAIALAAGFGIGGAFGIYYDEAIVNREKLETEVDRTRQLNQRLQVLLRMIRHNVRNELQIIQGHVEQLHSGTEDRDALEHIEDIEASATRLYSHSERALMIRELDPNVEPGTIDIVEVVEGYLDRLSTETTEATFRVDLPETATARAKRIIDVAIIESVRNSLRHNDQDGLVVEIEVTDGDEWVEITIEDNGDGVPQSERTVLSAEMESPLEHGSGVGLWLIRWVVEDSNGTVHFEENEPNGFRVRMLLPKAPDATK